MLRMLPLALHKFKIPDDPKPDHSCAEGLLVAYEEAIGTHLTAETQPRLNKANIMRRSAIYVTRSLRS